MSQRKETDNDLHAIIKIVNGKKYLLAYGDNGFIVSCYPI